MPWRGSTGVSMLPRENYVGICTLRNSLVPAFEAGYVHLTKMILQNQA